MKKITEIQIKRYKTEYKKDKLGNRIKNKVPYIADRPVEVIHGGQRFAHFFVDLLIYYTLFYFFNFLLTLLATEEFINSMQLMIGFLSGGLVWFLLYPLYYFLFELFTQSTPGKMLLKRVVIDEYGNKPKLEILVVRNLIRIVPFEALVCAFNERGWHDRWSNTYVISQIELQKIKTLLAKEELEEVEDSTEESVA